MVHRKLAKNDVLSFASELEMIALTAENIYREKKRTEGTPLNNVWLTMLQGVGVNVASHGDSTGVVPELQV